MATTKEKSVKPKTKEQRIKVATTVAYAAAVARLPEVIERLPAAPTAKKVREMLENRFQLAVDAAEVFESGWDRVRAKFVEPEEED